MVLTNPHMKPRIEFIIMKIFMKIVKICPKSPQFMVHLFWYNLAKAGGLFEDIRNKFNDHYSSQTNLIILLGLYKF